MKVFKKYFYIATATLIFSFLLSNNSFAIDELELNRPEWAKPAKTVLKGGVNAVQEKPLTGIGVVGLRYIHRPGHASFIEQVYPGSPSHNAGIRVSDKIFKINNIKTKHLTSNQVYSYLSGAPGSYVELTIQRGGQYFKVNLKRIDLANLSNDVQNRYLSGPVAVPHDVSKRIFGY